jgi:hypothetical protein
VADDDSLNRFSYSHGFAFPRRDFARVLLFCPALERKGAGNAGRSMRPQSGGPKKTGHTSVVTTVTSESPDIPRTMVYGYFVLSPVIRIC